MPGGRAGAAGRHGGAPGRGDRLAPPAPLVWGEIQPETGPRTEREGGPRGLAAPLPTQPGPHCPPVQALQEPIAANEVRGRGPPPAGSVASEGDRARCRSISAPPGKAPYKPGRPLSRHRTGQNLGLGSGLQTDGHRRLMSRPRVSGGSAARGGRARAPAEGEGQRRARAGLRPGHTCAPGSLPNSRIADTARGHRGPCSHPQGPGLRSVLRGSGNRLFLKHVPPPGRIFSPFPSRGDRACCCRPGERAAFL